MRLGGKGSGPIAQVSTQVTVPNPFYYFRGEIEHSYPLLILTAYLIWDNNQFYFRHE